MLHEACGMQGGTPALFAIPHLWVRLSCSQIVAHLTQVVQTALDSVLLMSH